MDKSGQRGQRAGKVDTEDRIMEAAGRTVAWARSNQRVATILLVVVLAAGAIGIVYLNYRSDLRERAAVRLDEIRLASQAMPPAEVRTQLNTYIEQFGSTEQAREARLLLAEMELNRDSAQAAVRLVADIVDLDEGPLGYNAGWLLAVAREQLGDLDAAAGLYERLARSAPHDFQRRRARAARAQLHTYAGEYDMAEAIYAELVEDDPTADDSEFYGVKLGEVRAMARAGVAPPELPRIGAPPVSGPADEPDDGTEPTTAPGDGEAAAEAPPAAGDAGAATPTGD